MLNSPVVAFISNFSASCPLIAKVESVSVKFELAVRIFCSASEASSAVSRTTNSFLTSSTLVEETS